MAGTGSRDKRFFNAVGHLPRRGIPVLIIYGIHDFRADFESELEHGLGAAMEHAGPPTRFVTVPVRLEGFASLDSQAFLLGKSFLGCKASRLRRPDGLSRIPIYRGSS